jgi:hypothetical protein
MPASASRWSRSAHPASTGTRLYSTGRSRAVQYSSHSRSAPGIQAHRSNLRRQQGLPPWTRCACGHGSWMPLWRAQVAGNILEAALILGPESFDLGYPLDQLLICCPLADASQCPARVPSHVVHHGVRLGLRSWRAASARRLRANDRSADHVRNGAQMAPGYGVGFASVCRSTRALLRMRSRQAVDLGVCIPAHVAL